VIVNTVHGLYATKDDPLPRRLAVYGLERLAATSSDAELVQNPEDLETLASLGVPRSRLHLLGNGIDLQRFRSGPSAAEARQRLRAEWGVGEDQVVVGAIGRLVLEKGYAELFATAHKLLRHVPQPVFIVVGPEEPGKADAVPNSLLADAKAVGVRLLGHRIDVQDIYAAFDIYVLASYREGFPRSAMEAAAMGLPIIATDIRGSRQVVADGESGLLVPRKDPDALGKAIERLIDDPPLRLAMGQKGAAKASREFDQQRVIDLTLEVYSQLRAAKAGPG
jgi:glycosyltransferase involved in cell wall biosynthesis